MGTYFDANATTEVDGRVADIIQRYLITDYGNAGSRTHQMGLDAKALSLIGYEDETD